MMSKLSRILPSIQQACRNLKNRKKKKEKVQVFLLLHLPTIVLEDILRQMESIDLFNLSICSKKTTTMIKEISRKNNAESCVIYLRSPRPCIKIKFKGFREDLFWVFDNDENFIKNYVQTNRTISGYDFQTFQDGSNPPSITCTNSNVLDGFLQILKHFVYLFPVPLKILVQPSLGNLTELFRSPLLKKCSEFEITRGIQEEYYIPKKTVEEILRFIKVEDSFKAVIDTGCVMLPPMFYARNINLYNGTWMCGHHLVALDCVRGKFRRHNFSNHEIEKFAMKWQAKPEKPRLERLEFTWDPFADTSFYYMETKEWDKNHRSKRCLKTDMVSSGTYDCSNTRDFSRSDGLTASIGLFNNPYETILIFHVWHDRFPTKRHHDLLQKNLVDLRRQQPAINRRHGVGSVGENELTNPQLTIDEFQEMMTDTYNHRLGLFGTSPDLDSWFDFHNQMLNVMKDIEQFD